MTSSKSKASRLAVGLVAATLALILSGCGGLGSGSSAPTQIEEGEIPIFDDGTTMKTVQDRGRLIVGVTPDQAPFASQNPNTGSWEGFDIETTYQIARSIFGTDIEGRVQFIPIEARDRESALSERRVDMAVGRYVITIARKRFVDFAGPYYTSTQNVMVRTKVANRTTETTIGSFASLNGKNVCTATGSTNLDALRSLAPAATLVNKATLGECSASLIAGQVSAVAADHVDLLPYTSALGRDYGVLSTSYGEQPYGIGVRLNNTEFRSHINGVLETWKNWNSEYTRTTGDRQGQQPATDRY